MWMCAVMVAVAVVIVAATGIGIYIMPALGCMLMMGAMMWMMGRMAGHGGSDRSDRS
jgi:hypothetical protein